MSLIFMTFELCVVRMAQVDAC